MTAVGNWTAESCDTVGAGDLILSGQGVNSVKFSNSVPNGDVWYSVVDGANREAGKGVFNGNDRIVRSGVAATLLNGVFNDVDPSPISLSGSAIVTCTFNAAAYKELADHLTLTGNPHNTPAITIPYDPTTDPVTSLTNVQDAMLDHATSIEERVASMSGIISGGEISVVSPAEFTVSDGKGSIFDSYTDPENTSVIDLEWSGIGTIILNTSSNIGRTNIFINNLGVVLQVTGAISGAHYRQNIFVGVVFYVNGAITEINNTPSIIKQTATDLFDTLFESRRLRGSAVEPVSGALSVWVEQGSMFFPGINWGMDRLNPNNFTVQQEGDSSTAIPFFLLTQEGTTLAEVSIFPMAYNDTGTNLINLPGNDATIHRLYSLGIGEGVATRKFFILYGQNVYNDAKVAKDNLEVDNSLTVYPAEIDKAILLAYIGISNDTDFDDINKSWIVNVNSTISSGGVVQGDHTTLLNRDAVDQHPIESIGVNAGEQLRDTLDGKMKWRNTWQAIAYDPNDVVRDGDWTMVANKPTSERPAPQPSGEPQHVVTDTASDNFLIGSDLSFVTVTYTFTMNVSGWIQGIRIYVPFFDSETVTRVEITDDQSGVTTIIDDPLLIAGQWVTVYNLNQIAVAGDTGSINLSYFNGNSVNDINGGWNSFLGAGDPALSEFRLDDLANPTIMTIDHTDLDSVNRDLELDGVSVDSLIQLTETGDVSRNIELKVTLVDIAPTDYTIYNVIVVSNGAKNVRSGKTCTVKISIPIAQASEYVFLNNHFPANPPWATISSEIAFDGVPQLGTSTTAYGVDLVFQEASVSLDWEFLALSSGGAGGGASGGATKLGASTVRNQSLTADVLSLGGAPPVLNTGFSAALYSGNEAATTDIFTDVDMTLGLGMTWIKSRNLFNENRMCITSEGSGTDTSHVSDFATNARVETDMILGFLGNGFQIGSNIVGNRIGDNFVAFTWKCIGEETGVTNEGSTYKNHYNADIGFSVIAYIGSATSNNRIPHRLNSIPEIVMIDYSESNSNDWLVTGKILADITPDSFMRLSTTSGKSAFGEMNNQDITDVILGGATGQNNISKPYAMWCFTSVAGFCDIGSYTGTGAIQAIDVGFRPCFLLIKGIDVSTSWQMMDSIRGSDIAVNADKNEPEVIGTGVVFTDTGFTVDNPNNSSGSQYLYMAIVESATTATTVSGASGSSGGSPLVNIKDPTNLTFSAGYNADGQSDLQESIAGDSLSFGAGHEDKYYYIFKDYKGAFGITELAPQIGNRVGDVITGTSDYYLLDSGLMYDPFGVAISRVYIGEVDLNSTGDVSAVTNYDVASQTVKLETFGGVSMKNLPSVDPLVSGALWNNAGVLNISAG